MSRSLIVEENVCLVQTELAVCKHGSSVFFIACVRWRICRQASSVTLISDLSCSVQQAATA